MNKIGSIWAVALSCLVIVYTGCEPSSYTFSQIEDLEAFSRELPEQLQQTVTQGGFTFTLAYQPEDLLMLNEHKYLEELYAANASESRIKSQVSFISEQQKSFAQSLHFKLIITPDEDDDLIYKKLHQDGFGNYSAWLKKLLFGLQEHVHISTQNAQDIPLLNYQMTRSFGTNKSRSFLLHFPMTWNDEMIANGEPMTIEIDEFGLGIGKVSMTFDTPFPAVEFKNNQEHIDESTSL